MTRYRNIVLLILLAIAIALLIIGSYYDLDISQAFADPACGWAWVMEIIAEPPTILLCSLMCGIIFLRTWKERKISPQKTPLIAFMFIAEIGTVLSTVIRTLAYLDLNLLIAIPIIPIISALIFALAIPIEKRLTPEMIQTTVSCVITALVVLVTINILKNLWGRVRYRDMYILGDFSGENFSQFTDWFKPNGINIAGGGDSTKSFPSGHTSNAVLLFYLSYYVKYLNKNKTKIVVTAGILISLWSIITAISRVAIGAHYLSDVTAGAAITGAIIYFIGLIRKEYIA